MSELVEYACEHGWTIERLDAALNPVRLYNANMGLRLCECLGDQNRWGVYRRVGGDSWTLCGTATVDTLRRWHEEAYNIPPWFCRDENQWITQYG